MESLGREDAERSLELISGARSGLADRLATPWWYWPALGALTGGTAVTIVVDSVLASLIVCAVFGFGIATLVAVTKRVTGMWVRDLPTRRTKMIVFPVSVAVALVVVITSIVFNGAVPAAIVVGFGIFVLFAGLGPSYDKLVRAELRSGG